MHLYYLLIGQFAGLVYHRAMVSTNTSNETGLERCAWKPGIDGSFPILKSIESGEGHIEPSLFFRKMRKDLIQNGAQILH